MIPNLIDISGPYEVLPAGIHDASLEEIEEKFAYNDVRKKLFGGLVRAIRDLQSANCSSIYVDGSFVTSKSNPNDFDVCWETAGVVIAKLDPVFLDFSEKRKNQKTKYMGECFPSDILADGTNTFLDYFQIEKETAKQKGIIKVTQVDRL